MNKWYKSAPCKGILLVLEHVLAAVMMVCLVWMLGYQGTNMIRMLTEKPKKQYEDTMAFEDQLQQIATEVIWEESQSDNFLTDGKIDEDKLVDVETYLEKNQITGKNESGLAYRLGDLRNWKDVDTYYAYDSAAERTPQNIVVCKKTDGTFYYYYADEFRRAIVNGDLIFGNAEYAKNNYSYDSDEEILNALLEQDFGSDPMFDNILDSERKQVYTSCWRYDDVLIKEDFAPDGAENLLEIVNTNPQWNGRLREAVDAVSNTAERVRDNVATWENLRSTYEEGNTNLVYLLVNKTTNKVITNKPEYASSEDWKQNLEAMKKYGKYVIVTPKLADFESNMHFAASDWRSMCGGMMNDEDYVYAFAVDTDYPIQDVFYAEDRAYSEYSPIAGKVLMAGILSIVGLLIGLIWLTIISGRSNQKEEVALLPFDHLKTEIFLVGAGCLFALSVMAGIGSAAYGYDANIENGEISAALMLAAAAALAICASGLILWLGIVRRAKARILWSNSILKWICKYLGKFVASIRALCRHIDLLWKAVLAFTGFLAIHWLALAMWNPGEFMILVFLSEAVAFAYLIWNVIGKNEIKKGVKEIASGNVNYQIPLTKLKGEQREVAECINKIGDGLDRAVEESMKSERLKTDLITNVSHDIKTPLTSIINYVELLKRENFEDPKIQNYIKVLEEKAYRLKTLTEDVVEASKVSSGNVKLEKINLNLVELINQTSAEFEEKFAARNLKLVVTMPEEPTMIYADGRRMWRVLANIFNNAAKYAMTGTRIYADLAQTEEEVVFTLKNVSEQPLNISADELTERFIRGDVSRSTEGSGLGLSIAQNLTKLQGGSFELYLDGDLFKVQIRFPRR